MSSPSKRVGYAEVSIDLSTQSSDRARSLLSFTSQNSFSSIQSNEPGRYSQGDSLRSVSLGKEERSSLPQIQRLCILNDSLQGPQALPLNHPNSIPSEHLGIVELLQGRNICPSLLSNPGFNQGNRGTAGPIVPTASSTQFRPVNGVYPCTAAHAYELNTTRIVELTSTEINSLCNQCGLEKNVVIMNCGDYLCKECIIIKCISDIGEFDIFFRRNDTHNLRRKFSYRCPVCMKNINFPTEHIFRYIEVRMELHNLGRDEHVYSENFAWFNENMRRFIKLSPYFDGLPAQLLLCKCRFIGLHVSSNIFLCGNSNCIYYNN